MPHMTCPCGLNAVYDDCCGRFHRGGTAPTAELLMRSRYAAFAVGDSKYLLRTWHSTTKPRRLTLDDTEWTGLTIVDRDKGGLFDKEGVVEFDASYVGGVLHERSRFVREDGKWVYLDAV
ncbi:MAG TPA: YchJ family metal-binding protein [Kutzneria sp.]|nr:YchJ family metal-binding protein [Kutzneria sp.]